jgi:hypothetical protein
MKAIPALTAVPRGRRPSAARIATTVLAAAALALMAAACGGSPSGPGRGGSANAGSSANTHQLAYSQCVRSHGVPNFPDPDSSGGFNKATLSQLAAGNSQYQAATQSCAHLLPNGGGGPTAAQVQQEWTGMLNFARCMHSHGEPNWPDPTPYPPYPDEPTFNLPASIQPMPQIISKMQECLRLVPNNQVLGHIDNNNWATVQQQMAGDG